MGAKRSALFARKRAIELCRDRLLGFGTAEVALELLAQSPPGAEQQRLDCRDRDAERDRDLRGRAALEFAHHERRTLIERQMREPADHVSDLGRRRVEDEIPGVVVERNLVWPAARAAVMLA